MYDTRDLKLMQKALAEYEELIYSPCLNELSSFSCLTPSNRSSSIQVFQVQNLPASSNYRHFTYILNALSTLDETIGCLLVSNKCNQCLYLMIEGHHCSSLNLLKRGFKQTFPNSTLNHIDKPLAFLEHLFNPTHYSCISSSLTIPNTTYSTPLLQDFINLLGPSSSYVAFFLARPISKVDIRKCLNKLYDLHALLSGFTQTSYTNYKSDAKTISHSTAKGSSSSHGHSQTDTCGENSGKSCNSYTNISASTPFSYISYRPRKAPISPLGTTTLSHNISDSNNNSISPKNINSTILINKATGSSNSSSSSTAHCQTCMDSNSLTTTDNNSISHTNYHAYNFSCTNKYIQDALTNLTTAIERYNSLYHGFSFCFSSYFFSACDETSIRAAYSYTGLTESSYALTPNRVNTWCTEHPHYQTLFQCLRQLAIPTFSIGTDDIITNSIPILSTELINNIYLPCLEC